MVSCTHQLAGTLFGGLVELLQCGHPAVLFCLILSQDQHLIPDARKNFRGPQLVGWDLEENGSGVKTITKSFHTHFGGQVWRSVLVCWCNRNTLQLMFSMGWARSIIYILNRQHEHGRLVCCLITPCTLKMAGTSLGPAWITSWEVTLDTAKLWSLRSKEQIKLTVMNSCCNEVL